MISHEKITNVALKGLGQSIQHANRRIGDAGFDLLHVLEAHPVFISSHPDIFYVGDKKKREKDIKTNFGFPNPSNPFAPKEEHKNPWDFDPNKKNPWEF